MESLKGVVDETFNRKTGKEKEETPKKEIQVDLQKHIKKRR